MQAVVRKGEYDVEKELREWLKGAGRVVIVGVGNPIRMDDFVGVKIVQDLQGKVDPDRVMLIEAETVPEDHMQEITDFRPTHILVIDAAIQGLRPGETRLIKPGQLAAFPAFATHMLPLRIFCEYAAKEGVSNVALLLVEPLKADFGEGLSDEVKFHAGRIVLSLQQLLASFNRKTNPAIRKNNPEAKKGV